jgi:hypothetical protein
MPLRWDHKADVIFAYRDIPIHCLHNAPGAQRQTLGHYTKQLPASPSGVAFHPTRCSGPAENHINLDVHKTNQFKHQIWNSFVTYLMLPQRGSSESAAHWWTRRMRPGYSAFCWSMEEVKTHPFLGPSGCSRCTHLPNIVVCRWGEINVNFYKLTGYPDMQKSTKILKLWMIGH